MLELLGVVAFAFGVIAVALVVEARKAGALGARVDEAKRVQDDVATANAVERDIRRASDDTVAERLQRWNRD